jgi:hypothetical protein
MEDLKEVLLLLGEIKGEQTGIKTDIKDIKKEQGMQREIVTNQRIKSAKVAGLVSIGGIGLWEVIKQKLSIG